MDMFEDLLCTGFGKESQVRNSMKVIPVRHLTRQSWQHFPAREAAAISACHPVLTHGGATLLEVLQLLTQCSTQCR